MRVNPLTVGLLASRLLPGALASPVTSLEDQEGGWILSSPGYLVPVDTPEDQFDVNAPWMTPIINPINRDANESVFDIDGFDVVPQRAAALETEGSLTAQASTRFFLGRNLADMGCGGTISSIRSVLGDAVYGLCKGGWCQDGDGVKYVRKIEWMGNGSKRQSRWLEITANGLYSGDATLGNIHNAVKASVRSESVKWAWRTYDYPPESWVLEDKCKMAKYPNNLRIVNSKVDVEMKIRLNTVINDCLVGDALAIIGGAIHGVVGAAFGAINMICKVP